MNYLEILGTFIGLIYLWLEYKASIYLWIAGIIMPAIYIFVYYKAGLYADFGINIYYLVAAVYGWIVWKSGHKKQYAAGLPITHLPLKYLFSLSVVFLVTLLGIAWILIEFTDSNVPWLDSFHSIEHCRHVDARSQICRAMVGMDTCGCCLLRSLYLQRIIFYFGTLRTLLYNCYLWLPEVETNDGTGKINRQI